MKYIRFVRSPAAAPFSLLLASARLRVRLKSTVCRKPAARQIRRLTLELLGYLRNNSDSLPNYGRRYRAGRRISSAFVESAVNQLIDKRMSKSQQMRWDPRSAHLLLQVRDARHRRSTAR